jgi:hypothetical protein
MYEFKLATNSATGILRLLSKLPADLDIDKLIKYISRVSLSQEEYDQAKARFAPPLSASCPASAAGLGNGRFMTADTDDSSCLLTAMTMCFVSLPYSESVSCHKE